MRFDVKVEHVEPGRLRPIAGELAWRASLTSLTSPRAAKSCAATHSEVTTCGCYEAHAAIFMMDDIDLYKVVNFKFIWRWTEIAGDDFYCRSNRDSTYADSTRSPYEVRPAGISGFRLVGTTTCMPAARSSRAPRPSTLSVPPRAHCGHWNRTTFPDSRMTSSNSSNNSASPVGTSTGPHRSHVLRRLLLTSQ